MKAAKVVPLERAQVGSMLDHMATLADPLRCRMLLVLERHDLTVSELCSVLQLPQSTVSRHLKTLSDAAWVGSRREGTSRYYSSALADLDSGAPRRLAADS
jgi:DNA-binding transcriptional ArsR family regulator